MGLIRSMFTLDVDSGMSDRDRITLSPIEKWRYYKRFPFKLVVHTLLIALVSIQLFVVVSQFTMYARSNEQIFAKFFLEIESDSESMTEQIWDVDTFLSRLEHIVETYYSLDDQTFNRFVLDMQEGTSEPEPIELIVHHRPNITIDNSMVESTTYYLTDDDPYGPFNTTKAVLKKYLSRTAAMDFRFELSSTVPTQFFSAPFRWSVGIHYKNVGGIFEGQVRSSRHIENQVLLYKLGWIPILIIIISSLSLTLGIKAIVASAQIYFRTKSAFNSIPKDRLKMSYERLRLPGLIPVMEWKDVPIGVRLDFFGSWYGLEILGEISLLTACFHGLINDLGLPISDLSRVFLGTGFLILMVGFAKYLEYWKKFYMLIITMQGSFQRNLRFVISVLPLYMGFCACGFIIFSPYTDDFASLDKSAITLFALLNGDDIHASFERIYSRYPYPVVGQVFLFTFIIMFITLVLNIFLFIIEDAYHAAKDFINMKAERHSKLHRRRGDSNSFMPPRLGDIDFDLPTLFDVIEESLEHIPPQKKKNIRKRSKSRMMMMSPTIVSPSINGDDIPLGAFSLSNEATFGSYITPTRALGAALSSTFSGVPSSNWGGRDVSANLARDIAKSQGILPPTATSSSTTSNTSDQQPSEQTSATSSTTKAPKPILKSPLNLTQTTSTELQVAIANTIASSQAEFLLEVDEKMKLMRQRFAQKLQQDLEGLLSGGTMLPSPLKKSSSLRFDDEEEEEETTLDSSEDHEPFL